MRIIVYTGKGGVGKTSVAAAAALRAASLGYRTIIMSTDAAHSLGDAFDQELDHNPTEITTNLWAMETNVYADLEANWGAVRAHIARLVALQGIDEVIADEAAILPGMDELFSLARIKELCESGNYDCIIVDAAPTGETLRLMALPQTLIWSVKLLRQADRYILKPFVRPLARLSPTIEDMVVPEEVIAALENMLNKLISIKKLLSDTAVTSVRLVVNPEKMVIKESKRALTYLNMYGLLVDTVVVNRMLAADSGYLENWRGVQLKYLEEVKESFSPLPIQTAPQYSQEITGLESLQRLACDLYGEADPVKIFFNESIFEIKKQQGSYRLRLRLPLLERQKMRIRSTGSELVLQLENQRRIISLPSALTGYSPVRASYENNYLVVNFERKKKVDIPPMEASQSEPAEENFPEAGKIL